MVTSAVCDVCDVLLFVVMEVVVHVRVAIRAQRTHCIPHILWAHLHRERARAVAYMYVRTLHTHTLTTRTPPPQTPPHTLTPNTLTTHTLTPTSSPSPPPLQGMWQS